MSPKTEMRFKKRPIGDFLGIVRCLHWVTDSNAFIEWMSDYHRIGNTEVLFRGYKLLFETLFRMLISDLEHNVSLGLSSDELFERASFRGISVFQLPNTCEKTIVMKNIADRQNAIITSRDWLTLAHTMQRFSYDVINELARIQDISILDRICHVNDVNTAIQYSSTFQVYIFLNDTRRGLPHGYISSMLENFDETFKNRGLITKDKGVFPGYRYGVQYLWSQLLADKFPQSVVKDLHETNDWESFDRYFDRIRSEIISPLEKSLGGCGFDNLLSVQDEPKRFLRALLKDRPSEKALSPKEQLAQYFLWYPILLIDGSEYDFAGIPTLIPMVMGIIQTKRRSMNKPKAKVIRLIHGNDEDDRRDYSYAVLSELSGFISDASGWVVFYDSCSDRGSTSGLYTEIEKLLCKYCERQFIDLSTIKIDKNQFIELAKNEFVNTPFLRSSNNEDI